MTETVFLRRLQFGHAATELRHQKQRVIAKTARTARRLEDLAVPFAFGNQRLRIVGKLPPVYAA